MTLGVLFLDDAFCFHKKINILNKLMFNGFNLTFENSNTWI